MDKLERYEKFPAGIPFDELLELECCKAYSAQEHFICFSYRETSSNTELIAEFQCGVYAVVGELSGIVEGLDLWEPIRVGNAIVEGLKAGLEAKPNTAVVEAIREILEASNG